MSVRDYAVQDILDDLRVEGKCFVAFHEELNPIMDKLVEEQNQKQLIASIV